MVGSDPGHAVAFVLAQASVLLACAQVNAARIMLHQAGRHIPRVLAVQHDVMLADIDISLGRPHVTLRLLHGYWASDFAALTAVPCARAHIALKDLRSAQDCVRSVLATASPRAGRFTLVDAPLCGAQIAQLSEDPGRALEMLIWVIEIAREDYPALHAAAGRVRRPAGPAPRRRGSVAVAPPRVRCRSRAWSPRRCSLPTCRTRSPCAS